MRWVLDVFPMLQIGPGLAGTRIANLITFQRIAHSIEGVTACNEKSKSC